MREPSRPDAETHRHRWQELASQYLSQLASGAPAELDDYLAQLDDPDERASLRANALAEEYLWRLAQNESVAVEDFVGRLRAPDERERFERALADARGAARILPLRIAEGTVLAERFRILAELGRGGMATVFEAEDLELQRRVAIKVVGEDPSGRGVDWERLREESRALARLDCPNVTRVFDVVRDGDRRYLAMDLVAGVTLEEALRRIRRRAERTVARRARKRGSWLSDAIDRPPEPGRPARIDPGNWYRTAASVVETLARTVDLAHSNGIVHRDLKPGNVMLTGGGDPVVLDFGLAGRLDGRGLEDEGFHGTPNYVAPEQVRAWKSGRDPRTDVYQVGLVLYELLTLRRAFPRAEGEGLAPLFERVQAGDYAPPRSVDPAIPVSLAAICAKALSTEPEGRYQSLGEMVTDLERFERGLPPVGARVSPLRALWLQLGHLVRRPTVLAAAAVLVALVLAVLLWADAQRWSGPALLAFGLNPGDARPRPLHSRAHVTPDETLGVFVDGDDRSFLYALSVFGSEDSGGADSGTRYARPLKPFRLDRPFAGREPWRLELEAGEHEVGCSRVSEHAVEGLLVLACAEEEPLLDRWLAQLDRALAEDETLPGVPYEDALGMLETARLQARGDSLAGLSSQEWERRYGEFRRAKVAGELEWDLDDRMIRFEVLCDVDRSDGP